MDNGRDGGNVIEIIGGNSPRNGADNLDEKPVWAAGDEYLGWDGKADPREEFQIPSLGSPSFMAMTKRSSKIRHCKKFNSQEGCPYGDSCTFLHDEQSKDRERVAILLGPGFGGVHRDGGANGNGGGGSVAVPTTAAAAPPAPAAAPAAAAASNSTKPLNWKTRICKKWEQTGMCTYGSRCIFAHGDAELHDFNGGLVAPPEARPIRQVPRPSTIVAASIPALALGPSAAAAREDGPRRLTRLDKLSKINRIYGDWIDDL